MTADHKLEKNFINPEKLKELARRKEPTDAELSEILSRAMNVKGLSQEDAAALLAVEAKEKIQLIMDAAGKVKDLIYGKRLVLFAPLYIGNKCSNNCLYCGFRKDNKTLHRVTLNQDQIRAEVELLLKEGHKRLMMLCGESSKNPLDYFIESLRTAYGARYGKHSIRRINVEIAPLDVEGFSRLKQEKIGTYVCFQETYDPDLYKVYHPSGPKADYENRLTVMDRAMTGGIDDVGIGALFGLADYKFEVLSMMEHAAHLEALFGCGPHTVSVPRIEPADNAPLSMKIPNPVSDNDFMKIIAVIRLSLPYTGIILSTRESEELRDRLFAYGVSQISAGSRTNPGGYSQGDYDGAQFSLGDHRSLDEVISTLIDREYIPSFCTGCYRKGRVGNDFMDLAKPGLIKEFCMPNGIFSFMEYLLDFAAPTTKEKGIKLAYKMAGEIEKDASREKALAALKKIEAGERDIYY